jgi:hypothetical protein
MKQRWGVSIQAIVHRAYDLGLRDSVHYRTANIHIVKHGWKKEEPAELHAEEPEVCTSLMDGLQKRLAVGDLCSAWPPRWERRSRIGGATAYGVPPTCDSSASGSRRGSVNSGSATTSCCRSLPLQSR